MSVEDIVQIAVVEDDPTIRTILEMALAGAGFRHVRSYARGDEAVRGIAATKPDLVLLDVMLPGEDGLSVARRIKSDPSLPATRIIMITAKTQSEDIVAGLDAGADDYVPKPFDRKVLLARIRAVLRRGAPVAPPEGLDGLVLDEASRTAVLDGEELSLPRAEFDILSVLAANAGRVMTRQRILDAVLKEPEKPVTERTIDVQIANIRRKTGRWAEHIETIRGVGYRIKL